MNDIPTDWDAGTYDATSAPQQAWADDVLARLDGLASGARVLDVGCGTGRVTARICDLVPDGEVVALDASPAMAELAREHLAGRATVIEGDVLALYPDAPFDLIVSTATLHWVKDHDRLWGVLAAALRPGGRLEVQCGGAGNIARVHSVIEAVSGERAPQLVGWQPWNFAGPQETERRLTASGFEQVRCWLADRPTVPEDPAKFIRTSILPAHLDRLAPEEREPYAAAVVGRVELPLDYVRLNVSAVRGGADGAR